jgi:hypothetical protein
MHGMDRCLLLEGSRLLHHATNSRIALLPLALAALQAGAGQITVPGDFADLHQAIGAAAAGDEILVSAGSYSGGLRINKPITVRAVDGPETTTIVGDGTGPAVILESGDAGGSLIGFTVTGGGGQNGGGLFLNGDVAVIDCTVADNTAVNGGGAFVIGSPLLSDVRFRNNTAHNGGGVFLFSDAAPLLDLCDFYGNSATQGGGMFLSPRGQQSTYATVGAASFENNAANDGAGIYARMSGFEVVESSFTGNLAAARGGAVFIAEGEFSTMQDCSVTESEADEGAAVYLGTSGELRIQGGEFSANRSSPDSGAIAILDAFALAVRDATLWDNSPESLLGEWQDLGGNSFAAPRLCEIDYAEAYGVIDFQDLVAFVNLFISRDPAADLAPPEGMFDLMDLVSFINAYFSRCGQ